MIICGRAISPAGIQILQSADPLLSQCARALRLCKLLNWIGPSGGFQISVARQVITALERTGVIDTREHRSTPKAPSAPSPLVEIAPLACSLEEIQPVELILVPGPKSEFYPVWKGLLEHYHYLGAGPLCGAQLRYLIRGRQGWLGAMAFSAAALKLQSRDQWIKWSERVRRENLHLVVNNSRFLIAQPVEVPNLASHVLAMVARRLPADWSARYNYTPVLLESFVDISRFGGGCYRAANWQAIGITAGRGRQDSTHQAPVSQKALWVYPLCEDFRQRLQAEPAQCRLAHALPVPLAPLAPLAPPQDWVLEELSGAQLPEKRLLDRAAVLVRDFFARPQASLPQACGSRAKTKAAYRFFDNMNVTLQGLLKGHYRASEQRAAAHPVVLAVQDSTELNYSTHPATEMLGPVGDHSKKQVGLMMHETMLYNLEGTPLGLLDVQCWVRDEPALDAHRNKPIEEKESCKWLKSFEAAQRLQAQCPQTQVVSMGDRESDVHELFVMAREDPLKTKLLVRACQDRQMVSQEKKFLWQHMSEQPAVMSLKLQVPRNTKQSARTAIVELRYGPVELAAPARKSSMGPVKLWAIWVKEVSPSFGAQEVQWMLLTNLPVESPQAALEKVQWYCVRFQIEVFHRTLKSGCKIEERQLGSAERIESCLAIDLLVAWRVVHLTKLGRETPQVPCTVFFEEAQWRALVFFFTKKPPPPEPPTLRIVQLMVAQLGGFLGRKSDGHPGVQVMWLGLQRLDDITQMWRAITSLDRDALLALMESG